MQVNTNPASTYTNRKLTHIAIFAGIWLLLFVLYLPAATSGFVTDFTGWLDQVRNASFSEYINRSNFEVVSLYQFTQLITYLFYLLIGANAWLWHLLFITLQAINALLAYKLFSGIFSDVGVKRPVAIALSSILLFCCSPYLSEVIVWEPSYHYLQGLLMLLALLLFTKQYIHTGKAKYIWAPLLIYLLSTHTLELFYITPWLVLSLAMFYHYGVTSIKSRLKGVSLYLFLPMLVMFTLRLIEYRVIYGDWVSRVGTQTVEAALETSLGKTGKYLFNLLFLGRYLPGYRNVGSISIEAFKEQAYQFFDTTTGLILVYGIAITILLVGITFFKKLSSISKASLLILLWTCAAFILIMPLWYSSDLMVIYDRYTYFPAFFLFCLVSLTIWRIKNKYIASAIMLVLLLPNIFYTLKVNRVWGESAHIINNLIENAPIGNDKTVVMLNLPEHLQGIPMMGAWPQSEYRLMTNQLTKNKLPENTYDGLSYNMITPNDGAHVNVLNDSTIRVTLNQWGTWWWYKGIGGTGYENEAYKLNLIDMGHFYELTLKQPINNYILLYQVGDQLKQVDLSIRNEEQY